MIDWRLALVVAGSLLTIIAIIPYIIETVKGKTKPRVASWFVWSVLTGLGAAAAITEQQWLTAILLTTGSFGTLLVVILGWKHGDRHFEKLDIICLIGALVGIALWHLFDSPAIGALAGIGLDLVGGLPTLVHAWKKPYEETIAFYLLSTIGAGLTLLALSDWRVTSVAYPIYLVFINGLLTGLLLVRNGVVHH